MVPGSVADQISPAAEACLLGWRFAEIYNQASYAPAVRMDAEAVPAHLPGVGDMSDGERAAALLFQVEHAMQQLGLDDTFQQSSQVARATIGDGAAPAAVIRRQVYALFVAVRNELAGKDPRLATALGLGRMLADTCQLPTAEDPGTYLRQFDVHRLQNAFDWLDELSKALPPDSARTVSQSLNAWAAWVAKPEFEARRRNRKVAGNIDRAVDASTTRALRRQGDLWRRLLSGEQDPHALLAPQDYVDAGVRMVSRVRSMAFSFVRRWWIACVLVIVALAGLAFVVIRYAPAGSSKSLAIIVSVLAGLGVSWKGVAGTLGKVVNEAQRPLWEAEVAMALSLAATDLPPEAKALEEGVAGARVAETQNRLAVVPAAPASSVTAVTSTGPVDAPGAA